MLFLWCLLSSLLPAEGAILDPALYLSPSPPLIPENKPGMIWKQPTSAPLDFTKVVKIGYDESEEQDSMMQAETFWPRISSIHFPIQFHLTGSYGGFGGSGLVASSYSNLSGNRVFGRPLAGSVYGTGLKIPGNQEAWTGWGNGKWGHYGKGK